MQRSVNEAMPASSGIEIQDHGFYFSGSSEKGVLLIHGLTGAPAEMRFVGKALNRLGFTVLAPRLAGHCQDVDALIKTKYEDWIDSLRQPLDDLKREVECVYTVGICVGGALGLMLAHLEPGKIDKCVIYSATLNYDGWNQPLWQRFGAHLINPLRHFKQLWHLSFAERPPYGIKDERMRRFLLEGASMKGILPEFPVIALYENFRLNRAMRAALPHMSVPTLLIHARDDDVSNPRNARKIQRLHGGQCEIAYVDESYHMIHVDRERELVARLTAEFFGLPGSKPSERTEASQSQAALSQGHLPFGAPV